MARLGCAVVASAQSSTYTLFAFLTATYPYAVLFTGGVTLLRAAAKNHARVTVVCDPADYDK